MTVSRVLAVCGLGLSSLAAAQPQTPSRSDPATPSSSSARSDESSLLKQLEGRWKVEVSIDPAMWNPHLFKDDARPAGDANKPGKAPSDKPASEPRDPSARTPDGAAANSKTVTGYSNVKLILGERVLQETTVLPDMKAKMARDARHDAKPGDKRDDKTGDKRDDKTAKSPGDDKFKGVSLLSFNENDKTYSMVFVDNCQGEMRHCTGTYDAGANRIVFNAAPHGHDKDAQHKSGPDHGKWQAAAGMQVVLEFVSPDEHRVTMYASDVPMSTEPARTPTGSPGDGNNPGASPTPAAPTSRDAQPSGTPGGKVVYRAVYHRASGADLDKFRDALRLSDAAER